MAECGSADTRIGEDIKGDFLGEVREEFESEMSGPREFISVCEVQLGAFRHCCTISRDVQVTSIIDAESIERRRRAHNLISVVKQRRTVVLEEVYRCVGLGQYTPDIVRLNDTVYPRKDFNWGDVSWEAYHCDGNLVWLDTADLVSRIASVC
jgi:hypothetical protein